MSDSYIDLHVHSYYSDGSLSPKEIISLAKKNNVGTLAVADHNVFDGTIKVRQLCIDNNIRYIPAVEIDTLYNNGNVHILAYGFNVNDPSFTSFVSYVSHIKFLLDESSVKLIEYMQKDYPTLSLEEYLNFSYDRSLGGWRALHYLMQKGLSSYLMDGIKYYYEYGLTYDRSGYSTIAATVIRIKEAGGYAVLAHPGEVLDTSDLEDFTNNLKQIISFGIDGIECYYPTHSEAVTNICLDLSRKNNLMITSGSDCHGVFGKTAIGEMKITPDKLSLKDLLLKDF